MNLRSHICFSKTEPHTATKSSPIKVCQMTSAHPPNDVRVYCKISKLLQNSGYNVSLIAPDASIMNDDGIRFVHIPSRPRFRRMLISTLQVFWKAVKLKADIYHFHDPELIPAGIALKLLGHKVVYDVHEDLPRQILDKPWIWLPLRKTVSKIAAAIENLGAWFFDGIVGATTSIAAKFPSAKTVTVQNFPYRDEWLGLGDPTAYQERKNLVFYAGVVSEARGFREMVAAIELLPGHFETRLVIAGSFYPANLKQAALESQYPERFELAGWQSRAGVANLINSCRIGLVLFHPLANHIHAQPNKLFEYMAAGIPVVTSNFPLWQDIVLKEECGLVVDPLNTGAIADAIKWLLEHPEKAEEMGRAGRAAVLRKFNWETQAAVMSQFYRQLCASATAADVTFRAQ